MLKNKIAKIATSLLFGITVISGTAFAATTSAPVNNTKQTVNKEDMKAFKDELKSIKNLPKEQRKAKMQELKTKYPNTFKKHRHAGMHKLQQLAKNNPQLANELKGLKDLPQDQKKAKIKELRGKYLKG